MQNKIAVDYVLLLSCCIVINFVYAVLPIKDWTMSLVLYYPLCCGAMLAPSLIGFNRLENETFYSLAEHEHIKLLVLTVPSKEFFFCNDVQISSLQHINIIPRQCLTILNFYSLIKIALYCVKHMKIVLLTTTCNKFKLCRKFNYRTPIMTRST